MGERLDRGSPPGRFSVDMREAGHGCTLVISGSYEEVLDEGMEHESRVHLGEAEKEKAQAIILALMKPDQIDWLWPPQDSGASRQS